MYVYICTYVHTYIDNTYIQYIHISDILKVLQDLKETSLHSVDILKHFVVRKCYKFCFFVSLVIICVSLNYVALFKSQNQKVVV